MFTLNDYIREILEARHYAILATHNEDGSIHTTPVWYVFEDGNFYVGTSSSSRKARNVAARPSATIMIDTREPGSESWVYAAGRVEILRGDDAREINAKVLRRYLTQEAIEDSRIGPGFATADDITLCVTPEVWRAWRSKEVDEQFFGGLLSKTPEKWFRPTDK